jgi:protein LSM14
MTIPLTDFDFASSNAKFNKPASPAGADEDGKDPKEKAYNPQKSFFDTLTPGPPMNSNGRGGGQGRGGDRGRGGRGRGGRRREEERERNVATFGEPGGVGLMGPGAYVGGWGGYGRRGGTGGQRGGRRGGPPPQTS